MKRFNLITVILLFIIATAMNESQAQSREQVAQLIKEQSEAYDSGDYRKALATVQQLENLIGSTTRPVTAYIKIMSYYRLKEYDKCISAAEAYLADNPLQDETLAEINQAVANSRQQIRAAEAERQRQAESAARQAARQAAYEKGVSDEWARVRNSNDAFVLNDFAMKYDGTPQARQALSALSNLVTQTNYGDVELNSVFAYNGTVYVAGEYGYSALLWVNGNKQILGQYEKRKNYFYARSVFVSNGDVYVAGAHNGKVALWKNGNLKKHSGKYSHANSVYVDGKDVYMAGQDHSSPGYATLWKNGKEQRFGDGEANSVFVSGGNVYVVGEKNEQAILWKNGSEQVLPRGREANSVFVSDGDVYVTGASPEDQGLLWKNGKIIRILDKGEYKSVYVSGQNIYLAGEGNGRVFVWMNDSRLELARTGKYRATVNSMFVSGGRIYVAGNENSKGTL